MKRLFGASLTIALAAVFGTSALAAELPEVKLSASNKVPECATPGRLMAYLQSRNPSLDPRFESVATQYMRHGEALGIRWDIAFFQMILETGALRFGGDVRPDAEQLRRSRRLGRRGTRRELRRRVYRRQSPPAASPDVLRRAHRRPGRRPYPQGAGVGRADRLAEVDRRPDDLHACRQAVGADLAQLRTRRHHHQRRVLRQVLQRRRSEPGPACRRASGSAEDQGQSQAQDGGRGGCSTRSRRSSAGGSHPQGIGCRHRQAQHRGGTQGRRTAQGARRRHARLGHQDRRRRAGEARGGRPAGDAAQRQD